MARAVGDREAARMSVLGWRRDIAEAMGDRLPALDWSEADGTPYFTGRPGWDGFGSLVLWAAYAEHPTLMRPARLPEGWDGDPAVLRSSRKAFGSRYSQLVCNAELWLPCPLDFTFECADIGGRRIVVGSVIELRRQLLELNGATWKADPRAVREWARVPLAGNAPLEISARYGFAVLLGLAERAVEHGLPMKLNY
ncbi:MAG: hypothetical protein ACOY4R_24815 [Pseudomonadota bacterium]